MCGHSSPASGLCRLAKNEGRRHPDDPEPSGPWGFLCGPALHPRVEATWCQTWCWLAHSIFRPHGSPSFGATIILVTGGETEALGG